ncbi:MAG: GTP cyclohydrolase II [Candidatus Hodarchaeales archaeon]
MEKLSLEEIISKDFEDFKNCHNERSCDDCPKETCVMIVAVADFPSKYGKFRIIGFVNNKDREENIALVKGDVFNGEGVLTRVHSACLTGDALGSLRCDCGPQLGKALEMIESEGRGIVLYMQQEGRGIGLLNKLRAYALQDEGFDTYDANVVLGFGPDMRDYEVASEMLEKLGVKSIRLITNNPEKIKQLKKHFRIIERVPLELPPSEYNLNYYKTKKERFGHYLSIHTTE